MKLKLFRKKAKYPADYKEFAKDILRQLEEYDKLYGTEFPQLKKDISEIVAGTR